MTKQQVLEKLQDHPKSSPLWNAIMDLIEELQELDGLQWIYQPDAYIHFNYSVHIERLHELQRRFGV